MRCRVIAYTICRAVTRAVVHDKNFYERVPAADVGKDGVERGREAIFLVVRRDNNRKRLQVQIIS